MTYTIDFLVPGGTTVREVEELNVLLTQLKASIPPLPRNRVEEILDEGSVIIVARNSQRQIIGMTTLICYSKLAKGLVGIVEDVVVLDSYRGRGIGTALMERVLTIAKHKRLGSIYLTSSDPRVAAHKMYEKAGFKKIDTNFFGIIFTYS
jgi:GNAT superfamily N-acetyltransferase